MNLDTFSRFFKSTSLFIEELQNCNDGVFEYLESLVWKEKERRYALKAIDSPPMTNEEFALEKLPAIKAYRTRTNCDLRTALGVWENKRKNKEN